jgi:hypothetical protein
MTLTVPARAPDLRSLTLDRESFAVHCPLALVGHALYPIPVRRPAGLATPLLSATRSRSSPCGSLGSLRSTPQRTYTFKSVPMLGTQQRPGTLKSRALESISAALKELSAIGEHYEPKRQSTSCSISGDYGTNCSSGNGRGGARDHNCTVAACGGRASRYCSYYISAGR